MNMANICCVWSLPQSMLAGGHYHYKIVGRKSTMDVSGLEKMGNFAQKLVLS